MADIWLRKNIPSLTTEAVSNDKGLQRSIGDVALVALGIGAIVGADFSPAQRRRSSTIRCHRLLHFSYYRYWMRADIKCDTNKSRKQEPFAGPPDNDNLTK